MLAASGRTRSGASPPDRKTDTVTIYILNTTILTTPGLTYRSRRIGVVEAKSMLGVETDETDRATDLAAGLTPIHVTTVPPLPAIVSAVGHQATAEIAATLLGRDVPVSREAIAMAAGDAAICVKLRTRAPEGAILTRAEVEAIGYDLVLLTAEDPERVTKFQRDMEHVAALLCYPDDDGTDEQRPASRRRGNYPVQAHFIVRQPLAYGGTYSEVIQEYGTDAWTIREINAEEAARNYASAPPAAAPQSDGSVWDNMPEVNATPDEIAGAMAQELKAD